MDPGGSHDRQNSIDQERRRGGREEEERIGWEREIKKRGGCVCVCVCVCVPEFELAAHLSVLSLDQLVIAGRHSAVLHIPLWEVREEGGGLGPRVQFPRSKTPTRATHRA